MSLLLLCVAVAAASAAWTLVALSMPVHWQAMRTLSTRRSLPPHRAMQCAALVLAGLAIGLCVTRDGWAMGMLLAVCIACASAYAVVLGLSWFSGRGRPAGQDRAA